MYDSTDCCIDITSIRVGGAHKTGIIIIPAAVEKEIGPQGG